MNDYDPVQLVKDANAFAASKFGKHYLAKLSSRVAECQQNALDLRHSREERADWAVLASEAKRQLDYFATARKTAQDPNLLRRMAANFKKRMQKEEADV